MVGLLKRVRSFWKGKIRLNKSGNVVRIWLSSKILSRFFDSLRRDRIKYLPEWTHGISGKLKKQLIWGFAAGDGCPSGHGKLNNLRISNTNLQMLSTLQDMAWTVGWTTSFYQGSDLNKYEHIGKTALPRYELRVQYAQTGRNRPKSFFRNGYVYLPIRSVQKEPYEGDVFNVSVPAHAYRMLGAYAHNCDDPTDQQDVRSPTTMQQQRERLRGVLTDRLDPGGQFFAILTRWGEADLVPTFESLGFTKIVNPIEGRYNWGRLLLPELFPDSRLQNIKDSKDEEVNEAIGIMSGALYEMTYMCDPSAGTGSTVKREWWKLYSVKPRMRTIIHSYDVSSGEGNDFTAYGSWGVGEDENYYLLDAGRWRVTMNELVDKMRVLYYQQRPTVIVVEDAGLSKPIIQYLRARTPLPIFPMKPGARDKMARLQGVVGLIEGGRVWIPNNALWVNGYVTELARFPGGQNDDYVDMTSQALKYLDEHARIGSTSTRGGHVVRV